MAEAMWLIQVWGDVEPILHGPSACVPHYDFRPAEVLFLFGLNGF